MNEKNKLVIEAQPHFIQEQSSPADNRYVFAYTITIRNVGKNAVKLIRRQWLITDSNGKIQEIQGEGVVGKQPNLKPGEAFCYTSGTLLETDVGTMQGCYALVSEEGEAFTAPIPRFTLSVPRTLH
jgi:ApaG protein